MSMKSQRGALFVELLLGGGVVIAAVAIIFAVGQLVNSKSHTQEVFQDVAALVDNVERGVGQQQSYFGLSNSLALEQHLVPKGLKQEGVISSRYGPIDLAAVGTHHEAFRVRFRLVPADACQGFALALAPLSTQLKVNGAVVVEDKQTNLQALAVACEEGGNVELFRWTHGLGMKAQWETWTTNPVGVWR